ncbi:hypothetical protein B0H67DRAFT_647214 [Lasiosphaeris hirsuta]|uniref:Uncharacterized protein n=1 Tax=Lasiosphaeris hirsuta TaxID=260670 RepID=A0AA40DU25_9PEZI|nr:hypothetical protein B0H67DRAFT_647214 [Lasiosphaeris hirsuta]
MANDAEERAARLAQAIDNAHQEVRFDTAALDDAARVKNRNLTLQPTGDFATFKHKFVRLAGERSLPKAQWKDEFELRLPTSLKTSLAVPFDDSVTFENFARLASSIALNLRERERDKPAASAAGRDKGNATPSTRTDNTSRSGRQPTGRGTLGHSLTTEEASQCIEESIQANFNMQDDRYENEWALIYAGPYDIIKLVSWEKLEADRAILLQRITGLEAQAADQDCCPTSDTRVKFSLPDPPRHDDGTAETEKMHRQLDGRTSPSQDAPRPPRKGKPKGLYPLANARGREGDDSGITGLAELDSLIDDKRRLLDPLADDDESLRRKIDEQVPTRTASIATCLVS